MILTKQLDLKYDFAGQNVSTTTPRNNLAKELEKYNRIEIPILPNSKIQGKPPSQEETTSSPEPAIVAKPAPKVKDAGIDRPNILSKRPHYRPQYRYDPQAPAALNLSTKPPSTEPEQSLDLSMKSSNVVTPVTSKEEAAVTELINNVNNNPMSVANAVASALNLNTGQDSMPLPRPVILPSFTGQILIPKPGQTVVQTTPGQSTMSVKQSVVPFTASTVTVPTSADNVTRSVPLTTLTIPTPLIMKGTQQQQQIVSSTGSSPGAISGYVILQPIPK